MEKNSLSEYSAKRAYHATVSAEMYEERPFYKGPIGWYRKGLERRAISGAINRLPSGKSFLDCPCGNGRWFELLGQRASLIQALDVSPSMLEFAQNRAKTLPFEAVMQSGDAEDIPLDDEAVDYTFSYALMKHLPIPIQYNVLREFARVSRSGVICSFTIFGHISYEFWRRRKHEESYPVFVEELEWMAAFAGLEIDQIVRTSTPIGLEHLVTFNMRR